MYGKFDMNHLKSFEKILVAYEILHAISNKVKIGHNNFISRPAKGVKFSSNNFSKKNKNQILEATFKATKLYLKNFLHLLQFMNFLRKT